MSSIPKNPVNNVQKDSEIVQIDSKNITTYLTQIVNKFLKLVSTKENTNQTNLLQSKETDIISGENDIISGIRQSLKVAMKVSIVAILVAFIAGGVLLATFSPAGLVTAWLLTLAFAIIASPPIIYFLFIGFAMSLISAIFPEEIKKSIKK